MHRGWIYRDSRGESDRKREEVKTVAGAMMERAGEAGM